MEPIKDRELTETELAVIDNCMFSADDAVLDIPRQQNTTPAERTRIAVTAAIKAGILNGVLEVTEKAGEPYWFQTTFK